MSREEFFLFAEFLPEPMCLISTRGDIIAINESAARFLDSETGVIQGKTLFEICVDSEEKIKKNLRNWSRTREVTPGPLNVRIGNSEVKSCNCNGSLLRTPINGSPAHILLRFELKEIFSKNFTALNNKIAELQKEIVARKLTQTKLEQERQRSIETAKLASLGEMAAGIAHEINNPLAIIDGSAQLLSHHKNNPKQLDTSINDIRKSCDRISRIVKSLKKFSRSSEHKNNYSLHQLSSIVSEAITLTNAKANRFHASVSFDCQSDALIKCDEVEIEQVVVNLINNGIYAVKDKSEKWVKLTLYEEDVNLITLEVMDSGTGIPKETQVKLFDPFFTTKQPGEGTGLGLSIAKGILDEHQARIMIDQASPNTCFIVKFNKHL